MKSLNFFFNIKKKFLLLHYVCSYIKGNRTSYKDPFFTLLIKCKHLFTVNPQHVGSSTIGHSPNLMGGTTSPGPGGVQPSLQGKKIPNENLTPQQLAHREEQLAVIAKLRQQIFEPKDLAVGGMDPTRGPPGSHCPTNLPPENNPNQCGSATMDWQKLQHGFMDGKNKVSCMIVNENLTWLNKLRN